MSKNMENAAKKIDNKKLYSLEEAVKLIPQISITSFDSSVDLALRLNLDVRKAEQQLRGSIVLPNGTGKKLKILVATDDAKIQEEVKKLKVYGIVNSLDLTQKLNAKKIDFDVIVAKPNMMPILGKFGKLLGPKGLMPNVKTGTITNDILKAVKELQKGKANYRTDKAGIVHASIGKVSMPTKNLLENINFFVENIKKVKPNNVKGKYIKSFSISPSMGPSIKIVF